MRGGLGFNYAHTRGASGQSRFWLKTWSKNGVVVKMSHCKNRALLITVPSLFLSSSDIPLSSSLSIRHLLAYLAKRCTKLFPKNVHENDQSCSNLVRPPVENRIPYRSTMLPSMHAYRWSHASQLSCHSYQPHLARRLKFWEKPY